MNSPEKNNYIQYVNRNGIVKAKNVDFVNDGTTTKFTVSGIDEDFFIFSVYENNIQRFCVGIENLDNTDMLGFINANMVDLSCIPEYSFLTPQTSVELSYNNEYVQKNKFGETTLSDGGGSSGGGSSDSDDLKYFKSLMKHLYPSHEFTFYPLSLFFSKWFNPSYLPSENINTCYFMKLDAQDDSFGIQNKLTPIGYGVETQYYKSLMSQHVLLTSLVQLSATSFIYGNGYRAVSNLPLFVQ